MSRASTLRKTATQTTGSDEGDLLHPDEPLDEREPRTQPQWAPFDAILQQMPFAVVVAEAPGGRIVFSNSEATRIFGGPLRQPESIHEYPLGVAVHLDGRPYAKSEYPVVRALGGETIAGEEMEIVRRDGTHCPVRVDASPVRDGRGQIMVAVGTFSDITKVKEAEKEHEELARRQHAARVDAEAAHARLALLAEISQFLLASLDYQAAIMGLARLVLPALGDACFIDLEEADSAHRLAIAHVNPTKAALLQRLDRTDGLTALVGRALWSALQTGRPEWGDRVQAGEQPGYPKPGAEGEDLIRVIDPKAYMVIPLVARGRVLGAMTFLVTESDRRYSGDDLDFAQHVARRAATAADNLRLYEEARQAREAAEEANRQKDEFLATLSHELRTPLNAILGWARMLRNRRLATSAREKALVTIERNALAQAQIIEDLLDVSRVITGSLRLDLEQVDVGPLIDSAITAIRPAAEAKGIRVECHVADLDPMVGDPSRLQQVAWNLLSNATKFTPPGGRIDVDVERQDGELMLQVRDTGIGIAPTFLPHIFERFRQADSTSTRVHGGLGLGLAIVRHLVELHGGTVEASSAGIGKGATFTVRIPVREPVRPPVRAPAGAEAVAPSEELRGVTVLVVDDEPDARDLFATILRQHGAAVHTAASAREALELLKKITPGVLVADIGMPGEDGYSLISRIRTGSRAGMPAVALTAYARPEDRRRALDAGFEMHLPKPVEPAELVNAVADLASQ